MSANKNKKIQAIFSEVPKTYEMVNHLLTFGFDILWRRRAARIAARDGGSLWMDVCSGTGEMAVYLKQRAPANVRVIALDFTYPMLLEAANKKESAGIRFSIGDVKRLPFPDDSFDLITISFATRNINLNRAVLTDTFGEFRRVLRPGGRFVNLETSQPANRLIRGLFHGFIRLFVLRLGTAISGSRAGYAYLSSTIPRFYDAETLREVLKEAGFESVEVIKMLFGAAAIHICRTEIATENQVNS